MAVCVIFFNFNDYILLKTTSKQLEYVKNKNKKKYYKKNYHVVILNLP